MLTRKVGKYQVGRTTGEGTFAKVNFAQNMETGDSVATKILAKSTILKRRTVDQALILLIFSLLLLFFPYAARLLTERSSGASLYN